MKTLTHEQFLEIAKKELKLIKKIRNNLLELEKFYLENNLNNEWLDKALYNTTNDILSIEREIKC